MGGCEGIRLFRPVQRLSTFHVSHRPLAGEGQGVRAACFPEDCHFRFRRPLYRMVLKGGRSLHRPSPRSGIIDTDVANVRHSVSKHGRFGRVCLAHQPRNSSLAAQDSIGPCVHAGQEGDGDRFPYSPASPPASAGGDAGEWGSVFDFANPSSRTGRLPASPEKEPKGPSSAPHGHPVCWSTTCRFSNRRCRSGCPWPFVCNLSSGHVSSWSTTLRNSNLAHRLAPRFSETRQAVKAACVFGLLVNNVPIFQSPMLVRLCLTVRVQSIIWPCFELVNNSREFQSRILALRCLMLQGGEWFIELAKQRQGGSERSQAGSDRSRAMARLVRPKTSCSIVKEHRMPRRHWIAHTNADSPAQAILTSGRAFSRARIGPGDGHAVLRDGNFGHGSKQMVGALISPGRTAHRKHPLLDSADPV